MFNLRRFAQSKIAPFEKALEGNRKELSNIADDNPETHEGLLKQQRKQDKALTSDVPTDGQMSNRKSSDNKILEKQMEREKLGDLYIPSINAFVEKMVQDRRKEFTKATKKESNWTTKKPKQNGALPAWPKNAPQHDKKVLNNDVNRKPNEEALIGGKIIKASVNDAVLAIKSGATKSFDQQIVDILKRADDEKRDLTTSEKAHINNLKQTRTREYVREV